MIKLAYLPSRVTGFTQPQDQLYYCLIQLQFRQWLNNQMILSIYPSKHEKVIKAYELLSCYLFSRPRRAIRK